MQSKEDIYFGVKGQEILLKKGSEIWEGWDIYKGKGYSFISYLYRSRPGIPLYSPFISEIKAKELGII